MVALFSQLITAALSISSVSAAFARGANHLPTPFMSKSQLASAKEEFVVAAGTAMDTPAELPDFESREKYMKYMETVSSLPKGFASGTAQGTFVSVEAPALGELPVRATVIYLPEGPTDNWAAVFTKNRFPGAPVIVGKSRLANGGPLQAIVINNKVSNVCSGGDGVADAELVCEAVVKALQLPEGSSSLVLPSSTGVIGWRLPAQALAEQVVPKAVQNLQSTSALNAAQAICTTDRYPKVRSKTLVSNGARVVGIAKGAGMVEPNMATMLAYIMTDATIPKSTLQTMLQEAVNESFNAVSVDGDESTSDTAVLIASNQIPAAATPEIEQQELDEFQQALKDVCSGLAADLVRNGEGTGHVMRIRVQNFPGSEEEARALGRHVVNSPLFKCAVAGNDPNTGRLVGAIGSFLDKFRKNEKGPDAEVDVSYMTLTLGGRLIFSNGKFVLEGDAVEKEISNHMKDAQYDEHSDYPPHQRFVEIGIDFGAGIGNANAVVYGSDLTAEYVVINGDYRS